MTLLASLFACSTHTTHIRVNDHMKGELGPVTRPVFAVDHSDGDPFRENTAVGNFTFSGGYVTESTGEGMFNVSKEVALEAEETYREHVSTWLDDLFLPTDTVSPPPLSRKLQRGSHPADGHDNVSLPRADYRPVPLDEAPGHPVTVPIVVSYYTHNGGWFFGQEFGTAAGARVRVVLVTYDGEGQVVGWRDVDASRTSDRVFSPTSPQLQDLLIRLEKRVGRRLAK